MSENDAVNYDPASRGRDGVMRTRVPLTLSDDQRTKNARLHTPWVIPIVFIPGIMGTNLRRGDAEVWRPPNMDIRGAAHAITTLFTFLFRNAEERGQLLSKDKVEIDHRGSVDTAGSGLSERQARERGWGSVMRSSYHPVMGLLEEQLNRISDAGQLDARWKDGGPEGYAGAPTDWGAQSELPPLSEAEIRHAARYRFEVWAAGYNWLQSNRESGAAVRDYIENTVLAHYRKHGQSAEKVIVVTHSMGGMVSRALTEIHQYERVLGVIHGVQPATGAPATYKRMRAGFEGMAKVVLGRNAAEVVAVLAKAPGGLELLLSADYNGGKPWLKVIDKSRPDQALLALPEKGDPYGEIYSSRAWYGLIPDAVDGVRGSSGAPADPGAEHSGPLLNVIKLVRNFHEDVQYRYKHPTYAHFGAQGQRDRSHGLGGILGTGLFADSDRFAWGEVVWRGEKLSAITPSRVHTLNVGDNGRGELTLADGNTLEIAPPDVPGDGTVPMPSGAAPFLSGTVGSFVHGQGHAGVANESFGYDHQDSYNDPRSRYATIYGLIKIAQLADWRPE